jgi:hypothetical protein
MLDLATHRELARLTGFLISSDADTRRAAAVAIEALLATHGTTLEAYNAEMEKYRPLADHLDKERLLVPPCIRPGGEWFPLPSRDGTLGYATLFDNGVSAYVIPTRRAGGVMWYATIDRTVLTDGGIEVLFPYVRQAIETVERVAQRLFQHPAWGVVIDPTGNDP